MCRFWLYLAKSHRVKLFTMLHSWLPVFLVIAAYNTRFRLRFPALLIVATIGDVELIVDGYKLRAVCELLEFEGKMRKKNKRKCLMKRAAFPVMKSIEDFDFTEAVMPEGYSKEEMIGLEFVKHAQDFVFCGKTGRGKAHLAIAIGVAAVNAGYEALFFSTASLDRRLTSSLTEGELEAMLKDIRRADIVILDELGYIPLDVDGARLLFQVISESYESRSLILTTSIEFSRWISIFADKKLAAAAVDRIVHHDRLVKLNGPSSRMDASLMLGKGEV